MLFKNKALLTITLLCMQATLFGAAARVPIDYSGMTFTLPESTIRFIEEEKRKPLTDKDYKVFQKYIIEGPLTLITLRARAGRLNEIPRRCTYENPIYVIGECASPTCPFSRCVDPSVRTTYENKVVEKLSTIKQPINWLSFASGDLFLDLAIMTKFLSKHPKAKVNLHALDRDYDVEIPIENESRFSNQKHKIAFYQNISIEFRNFIKRVYPKAKFTLTTHYSKDKYFLGSREKRKSTDLISLCDAQRAVGDCLSFYETIKTVQKSRCDLVAAETRKHIHDGEKHTHYHEA